MKKNKEAFVKAILYPYRGRIVVLCLLTVVLSVMLVATALLSRFVIDAALGAADRLLFWSGIFVADVLGVVLLHTVLSWYTASTTDAVSASMRKRILRTAVYSRDESLLEHHSGELLNRCMEDVRILCDGAIVALPGFVGQTTRLVAAFAAVWILSPEVAAVLFAGAVVIGLGTAFMRPALKKQHRMVRTSDEQVMAVMQEDLQQSELIQSLGAQEQSLRRFGKALQENLWLRFSRRVWLVGSNGIINTASQLSAGALLLWGASRIATGALSYGSLTAMIQLLAQFRGPVLGLSGLWSRLAAVEVAAERLAELMPNVEIPQQQTVEQNIKAIVFENVTFAYPGEQQPVLRNVSFRYPLEDWCCLTGISGKGKSTVFKLILGLFTPQEGRIYLETGAGEVPCSEATRHLFAYVPQDYAMFSGTVLENFQLIEPDITQDTLHKILHIAQADFVWDLADAENTQVRENNEGLSKGQLQRLAIARAVLMDRPILLLDECTSALDAQTEDDLLQSLKALDKKAILVTHRPEAVEALGNAEFVSMK